jgi:hypothetical protein
MHTKRISFGMYISLSLTDVGDGIPCEILDFSQHHILALI